jgi:ABC-type Fe3+/spermidine/putrescine transport system ATPase subunit
LKLQRDLGITTIYVTHDQEEALALSTRIAVMNLGSVVQQGEPREIYERPRHRFVAEFVGKSNLFFGSVIRAQEGLLEIRTDEGFLIHAESPLRAPPGAKLILNVRPEAIELAGPGERPPQDNRLPGTVVASAYQGSMVEYEIATKGRSLKANLNNPKEKPLLRRGDEVLVVFAPKDVGVIGAED